MSVAETQYILKAEGLLDQSSVEKILTRLAELLQVGYRQISLDCAAIERSHFAAVEELFVRLPTLLVRDDQLIELTAIPVSLAAQLQLLGCPVSERAARFMLAASR